MSAPTRCAWCSTAWKAGPSGRSSTRRCWPASARNLSATKTLSPDGVQGRPLGPAPLPGGGRGGGRERGLRRRHRRGAPRPATAPPSSPASSARRASPSTCSPARRRRGPRLWASSPASQMPKAWSPTSADRAWSWCAWAAALWAKASPLGSAPSPSARGRPARPSTCRRSPSSPRDRLRSAAGFEDAHLHAVGGGVAQPGAPAHAACRLPPQHRSSIRADRRRRPAGRPPRSPPIAPLARPGGGALQEARRDPTLRRHRAGGSGGSAWACSASPSRPMACAKA